MCKCLSAFDTDVFVTVSFCHWQSTGQCMRSHLQQVTSLNSLVRYFTYLITQSCSVWCLLNRIAIHSPTWKRSHFLYAATILLEHDQDFLPVNEFAVAWACEKVELEYKLTLQLQFGQFGQSNLMGLYLLFIKTFCI